jgi:hypothetical protein
LRHGAARLLQRATTRTLDCTPIVAACPKCRKDLKLNQLSSTFACPNCGVALRSNFPELLWWVIPLAIFAELILYLGIYNLTMDGDLTLLVFLSFGGLMALLVYWALSALLSRAELNSGANGENAI